MEMLDKVNKRYVQAMKDRDNDAKAILSIIKNKILLYSIEKQIDKTEIKDDIIINLIEKVCKDLKAELQAFEEAGRVERVQGLKIQLNVVEEFLPKQLTEDEIKNIIAGLEDKSFKNVVNHFKTNFNGQCDMRLVTALAKEFN